jgi:hypothetical protein
VFAAELGQVVAHGEPGLSTADDDGVVLLAHSPEGCAVLIEVSMAEASSVES